MPTESENNGQTEQYTDPFAAMEETMSEAFDKASGDADAPQDKTDETTEADAAPVDGDDATDEGTEGAPADEGEEGASDDDQGSEEGEGAESGDSLTPPERWSADDKEQFKSLTPEAQKLVLKREADVEKHLSQKSQEISEEKKRLGSIADMIDERREAWGMEGVTPDQAITQLLSLSDYAGRDPEGFINWFAQQRGLNLSSLAAGSSEGYGDPEIQSLKQEIQRLKDTEAQRTQQTQQTQRQAVQQAIEEFSSDKTNAPYFDELQQDIATLLPSVRQTNPQSGPKEWLKIAYDKAVWANETTRKKELDRQRKADTAKQRTEDQKAADKAKKQGQSNVKGKPGVSEGSEKRSMEETMSWAHDKAVGAA